MVKPGEILFEGSGGGELVKHCLKIYSSTICMFPVLIERFEISWYCIAVSSVSVDS